MVMEMSSVETLVHQDGGGGQRRIRLCLVRTIFPCKFSSFDIITFYWGFNVMVETACSV